MQLKITGVALRGSKLRVASRREAEAYNIGIELTASECAWLAQEINEWLKQLR